MMSGQRQSVTSNNQNPNGSWQDTLEMTKSALRWDIKRSMKGLCKKLEEIGEECFVVTVNINNGWVGHIGTLRGDEYIDNKSHILYDFLNYCAESVDMETDSNATSESDSDSNSEISYINSRGIELSIYEGDNDNNDNDDDDDRSAVNNDNVNFNGTINDINSESLVQKQSKRNLDSNNDLPVIRGILQSPVSMATMLHTDNKTVSQHNDGMDTDASEQDNTESQLIITDVRTQLHADEDGDSVTDDTLDKNTRKQVESKNETKHPVNDTSEQSDDNKRVTRSKNSRTRCSTSTKKSLAHLLSKRTSNRNNLSSLSRKVRTKNSLANLLPLAKKRKCESTVDDDDKDSSSSSCDEVIDDDDIDDYIEQDDPNDEDWEIENI